MMTKRYHHRILIVALVLISYAVFLFPTIDRSTFHSDPHELYSYLTAGFLQGDLDLAIYPPSELQQLTDPYNPNLNYHFRTDEKYKLHDMSLYNGKLYSYFGPLPVFTFFMPFKFITGFYPPEALAVFYFLSGGFLIGFLLLIKIKEAYFPALSEKKLLFSGLIIGLANNAPFLISRPKFYEVAIASAFCLMSLALFFLFQFLKKPEKKRYIFLCGLSLSLSVAGRPHFALACLVVAILLFIYLLKYAERKKFFQCILALFLPMIVMGFLLGFYNYFRFHSLFEFGQNYQLAAVNVRHSGLFNLTSIGRNWWNGLSLYLFHPFILDFTFPFIHWLPYSTVQKYLIEPTYGIFFLTPFVLFIFLFPGWMHYLKGDNTFRSLRWFLLCVVSGIGILFLFLISLSGVSQRYEMDFNPYLIFVSIIIWWLVEQFYSRSSMQLFFVLTALWSIYIGVGLGLATWGEYDFYFKWHASNFSFNPIRCLYLSLLPILVKGFTKVLE